MGKKSKQSVEVTVPVVAKPEKTSGKRALKAAVAAPVSKKSKAEKKVVPPPKKVESSSSEEESGDEEEVPVEAAAAKVAARKVESSHAEDSDDEDDSDDDKPAAKNGSLAKAAVKDDDTSDEEESDEESEEEAKVVNGKAAAKPAAKESSEEESEEEEEKEEVKTPAKPTAPQGGSRTLFVKNLAWAVTQDSLYEFFADAGTVVSVRLGTDENGQSRGFCHVEFEDAEGAQKGLSKSGSLLEGREVFCDLARERGDPPSGGKDWAATYVQCQVTPGFE
jgi:nucleolin